MKKILVDLNIILDFLQKRQSHEEASKLIDLCYLQKIQGYICAHEITTLSYFLHKEHKDLSKVKYVISQFLDIFNIIPISGNILKNALNSNVEDYEDAVIEICAIDNNIDYIISRNLNDFSKSKIKAISPSDFLILLNKQKEGIF
jgi:predicted nucleic acid-binding protein